MTQKFNPPSLHMSAWYEENEENAGGASSLQTHAGIVTIFVIVLCVRVCKATGQSDKSISMCTICSAHAYYVLVLLE